MVRKTSDVNLIKQTLEKLFRAGINVKAYFVFGFKTENIQDMQMSYDLAIQLKKLSLKNHANFRTSVFQFRPYHGTDMYNEIISKGRIIDEVVYHDDLLNNMGRNQFNFTSGNYSDVTDDDLRKFIVKTNGVNQ